MVFEAQNFDTARNLGINYIPCCKIVLMFYKTKIEAVFFDGFNRLL